MELPFDILRPEAGGDDEGLSDITLAAKFLIFPEQEMLPSLVLKTAVKLSNGDENEGFGSGDEDVKLILAATKSFEPVTIHGNIGYTFAGDDFDAALNDTVLYGLALQYSLCPKLDFVCEIFGEADSDFAEDAHVLSPLAGVRYNSTERITFDTAYKMGIQENKKPEFSIISGITVAF